MLVGNAAFIPGNFESISTVIVGAGGSSFVEFTSIPQTYANLQIRGIGLITSPDGFTFQFNSDTGSNYSWHQMYADGSNINFNYGLTQTLMYMAYGSGNATSPSAFVTDILDYKDTNKYKTIRSLSGNDISGAGGNVQFWGGNWRSASAVTSIKIMSPTINQYSKFALYGIKD